MFLSVQIRLSHHHALSKTLLNNLFGFWALISVAYCVTKTNTGCDKKDKVWLINFHLIIIPFLKDLSLEILKLKQSFNTRNQIK